MRSATHPKDVLAHIRDFNITYVADDQVQGLPTWRMFFPLQYVFLCFICLIGTHVTPSPTFSSRGVFSCFAALGYFFANAPEAPLT